jgi:hypothetical protein
LTLPGELFVVGFLHQERVPAFVGGLEGISGSGEQVVAILSDAVLRPQPGAGLPLHNQMELPPTHPA